MKRIIIIIFVFIQCQLLFAQTTISISANAVRHEDDLLKIQIPYIESGNPGNDIVWQLGIATDDSPEFLQSINSNGDTIAIYEEGRMLHFVMRNDTLYDKGIQSRRAHRIYAQERPVLHYPFGYGDRIEGSYAGVGRDENLTYTVDGNGYTEADGFGVLTDGTDTLRHVTRLHMHDEYILDYGEQDLQHLAEDRYLWYCAGYRYPVQETWQLSLREDSTLTPLDSTAYLYLPVMQLADLPDDPENAQIQADLAAADDSARTSPLQPSGPFSPVSAKLSPDGTSIILEYELASDVPLHILASDILGTLLGSVHYASRPAGIWQDHLTLSRRPVGGIAVVNVECGMQSLTMKMTSTE